MNCGACGETLTLRTHRCPLDRVARQIRARAVEDSRRKQRILAAQIQAVRDIVAAAKINGTLTKNVKDWADERCRALMAEQSAEARAQSRMREEN